MINLEDYWFNQPELHDSEVIGLAYPANQTQDDWRAVGGKLFITNRRVIFLPHKFDSSLGGKIFEMQHEEIASFSVKEKNINLKELFSGGLMDRLEIKLNDGTAHLFVMGDLAKVKKEIETELEHNKES